MIFHDLEMLFTDNQKKDGTEGRVLVQDCLDCYFDNFHLVNLTLII